MAVQRPNKLYAKRVGDRVDQVFYYDGKSLTLHDPAAEPIRRRRRRQARWRRRWTWLAELDIVAPAGDLIYSNAFELLMQEVTEGFVVGKGVVDGVRCDHLAFRAPHVDWQIWIQEGKQPLPRKFVITTRDMLNAPQFSVVITRWNVAP